MSIQACLRSLYHFLPTHNVLLKNFNSCNLFQSPVVKSGIFTDFTPLTMDVSINIYPVYQASAA